MTAQPISPDTNHQPLPDNLPAYLRIFRLLTIYSSIGVVFFSLIYRQTQAWQLLLAAIFLFISCLISLVGYRQAKTTSIHLVNFIVFIGFTFAYSSLLLVLSHAEGYLLVISLLAFIPACFVIHKSWSHRIIYIVIFLLISFILSRIPIIERYDIDSSPQISIFLFVIILFVVLQGVWLLGRNIKIKTIKARLLISFVMIAVIPLIIITGVATSFVIRATEKSALDLLTVVVNLKEIALHTWIDDLTQTVRQEATLAAEYSPLLDLLEAAPGEADFEAYRQEVQNQLVLALNAQNDIREYLILDQEGLVLQSSNPIHAGILWGDIPGFSKAANSQSAYTITELPDHGERVLQITLPIQNDDNEPAGFFVGIADMRRLSQIMSDGDILGETGEVYLVASDLTLLTGSNSTETITGDPKILTLGALDAILGKQTGRDSYENATGTEIFAAYSWLDDLDIAIFAEQSRSEVFLPVISTTLIISAVSILLIAGAVFFGLSISNSIGKPLAELTSVSKRIAGGELDLEAAVDERQDEISELAEAFNKMTQQLRIFISSLERRVQERTYELEERNTQLIAASQLGNSVTSFLDMDELVQQAVNLIQEKFNLYYVGLFLLDETHNWATLRAGTGHAGRVMLERGHRIKVGDGMIGWCIQNTRARIALQADEDTVRLATPDLPETRSEAAIPLRSRSLVIGALTIQSNHSNAFDQAMITIFQTMADQIAIAIDNAMLIDQAKKAIEATRQAYGELSHKAWLEQISSKQVKAVCNEHGVAITNHIESNGGYGAPDISRNGDGEVYLPIKVRGSVLGYLKAHKPAASGTWTDDEKEMLSTLTEQLGAALDSARLFEETLTRAEQERTIGYIASRVRETLDIETVLKTATLEMQKALDLEEVEVRMNQNIFQDQRK